MNSFRDSQERICDCLSATEILSIDRFKNHARLNKRGKRILDYLRHRIARENRHQQQVDS